jgi:5-methylcytosine-specific restriction endonuclease McrA
MTLTELVPSLEVCQQLKAAHQREYYASHRTERLKYNKEYYAKNRDELLMKQTQYNIEHREEMSERRHQHYAEHRTELSTRQKKYRAENLVKVRELEKARALRRPRTKKKAYLANYRKEHQVEYQVYTNRRRALQRENTPPDLLLTAVQWREILERYHYCCAYCGTNAAHLTIDHVIPVSRGGQHTKENIVPACQSCNSAKHDHTLEEWGEYESCTISADT